MTCITIGNGPFHMLSTNGSKPSLIDYRQKGPLTVELGLTEGAQSQVTLTLANLYINATTEDNVSGLDFGFINENVTDGYESSIPNFMLETLFIYLSFEVPH